MHNRKATILMFPVPIRRRHHFLIGKCGMCNYLMQLKMINGSVSDEFFYCHVQWINQE